MNPFAFSGLVVAVWGLAALRIGLIQLLFIYVFLLLYAAERSIFAFKVSDRIRPNKNAWLTVIPFFTYIALFFISVIEFSIIIKPLNVIVSLLGILIFVLGISLRYSAVISFYINRQKWISHIDTKFIDTLVQDGPYKIVRHPYYLSVVLELCGVALLLNAFGTIILIFLIQIPLLYRRIAIEESELIKKFGEKYQLYKNRVASIFPLRRKR